MTDADLARPVQTLRGVGPAVQEKLNRLGIFNVQDVLFHLPLRYQDRTRVAPIGSLELGEEVVVEADIQAADVALGKRRSLLVRIHDGTGGATLRFFHFNAQQQQQFKQNTRVRIFGEARRGPVGYEFVHPEYSFIDETTHIDLPATLTPVYPSTEGLSQTTWRKLTDQALLLLEKSQALSEYLPDALRQQLKLQPLREALLWVHRPPTDVSLFTISDGQAAPIQRLAFEELLAHHLSMQQLRASVRKHNAPVIKSNSPLVETFLKNLPFQATRAQQRVSLEIEADLQQSAPMLRLVQGDVGSGKTLVAALAAFKTVSAGYQVALMAPTEILAEQHYKNFAHWCEPLGIQLAWLSGKTKAKPRREALEKLANGSAQIAIGTHALFQDEVQFAKLGLAIIDEQHRFGVHQRLALRQKGERNGNVPHQLIMTATPIPRTLAMTAYADLDTSIIDELPPGRTPITTLLVNAERRDEIVARVAANCEQKRQAYWVCTLIEESEVLQAQAAETTAEQLREALPHLQVGLVHGGMKVADKQQIMEDFKQGQIDLLVATTVIEVGVDVPNSSLMVIENAERLGLAQLHQLRGRVGRGSLQSFCVLLYQHPLSRTAKARLQLMRETQDGFVIAEKDLELRGPGEVLGTRQTGEISFKIADLSRDQSLLEQVKGAADWLAKFSPESETPLIRRWLGENPQYANV